MKEQMNLIKKKIIQKKMKKHLIKKNGLDVYLIIIHMKLNV